MIIWVFLKKIVGFHPQNGWFIKENPIKMDDLGGKTTPIFGSTPIYFLFYIISRGFRDATTETENGEPWNLNTPFASQE